VARWTGSAANQQEWQLIVVTERGSLDQLAQTSRTVQHLGRAPLAIAIVMPGQRKIMEAFDEGRMAERIMLAALAHGLGSSIGWVSDGEEQAKRILGIPADRKLRTVISIGFPDEAGRRFKSAAGTARKPLGEIVHRDRWGSR
jgi:nitroreductase